MGNIRKEALTPDTQLTFTCFLNKRFFDGQLLHQGAEEYYTTLNNGLDRQGAEDICEDKGENSKERYISQSYHYQENSKN